ncbi:MAG: M23 family metallopeptidase [Balneolales bacterium]
MIELIKKLFERRNENTTLILLDEEGSENPKSFLLKPYSFFVSMSGINLALLILISVFLYITPIGNMIFNKNDQEIRRSVVEISQRLMSLEDSLNARDQQLTDMKSVLAEGIDTVFTIQPINQGDDIYESTSRETAMETVASFQTLDANQIIYSRNIKMVPDFPVDPPLLGTVSHAYDSENKHYGIDIAASEDASAQAIADGVVINADWTMNYGYVVHVHHGNGYMSIYKHLSKVYKEKGDIIFKGDVLGTVGVSGVLTSGPHIHFELWRDGIALDPFTYLTNLTEAN